MQHDGYAYIYDAYYNIKVIIKPHKARMGANNSTREFAELCSLTEFATNSAFLAIELPAPGVAVLSDLVSSGVKIDTLFFVGELPSTRALNGLSKSIREGAVRSLVVSDPYQSRYTPVLVRTLVDSMGPTLEYLHIVAINLSPGSTFSSGLERCTALKEILIINCTFIRRDAFSDIASGIGKAKSLELVRFEFNIPTDGYTVELAEALNNLPGLRTLCLRCAEMDRIAFWKKLSSRVYCGVQNLSLNETSLGDDGISAIVEEFLLHPKCNLQTLSVASNDIGPAGGIKLAQLISCAPNLHALNISANTIGSDAAEQIGNAIKRSCAKTLTSLNIFGCKLGPRGFASLLGPLRAICTLDIMRLSGNFAGDAGAMAVSNYLLAEKGSQRGKELDMQFSNMREAGAKKLAKQLSKRNLISRIALGFNNIGPCGCVAVLDALTLAGMHPMEGVELTACFVGDTGAQAMAMLIRRRGCREIGLAGNDIHAKGIKSIVSAVETLHASSIAVLDLRSNPIENEGLKCITKRIIKKSEVIEVLVLCGSPGLTDEEGTINHAVNRRNESALKKLVVVSKRTQE